MKKTPVWQVVASVLGAAAILVGLFVLLRGRVSGERAQQFQMAFVFGIALAGLYFKHRRR